MVGTQFDIIAFDPQIQEVAWHCAGPDTGGACPGVAIGAEIPCIGKVLTVVGASEDPYIVPAHMTLCPVTLASALGVPMGRHLAARMPAER